MTLALADPNLDKPRPLVTVDRWEAYEMRLEPRRLASLWTHVGRFRTLFSDLTRGDLGNFLRFVTEPHSMWFEIAEFGERVGIVCFTRMDRIIDADAHVIFFDRDLTNKVPICQAMPRYMFDTFPLQRVTVDVPHFYYATIRLVKAVGFKQEGERRNAVLIGGRWANVSLFGITREEVGAI